MTDQRRPKIVAIRGDITKEEVDVIVNAANSNLAGGGGVDGAIHRAAGADELRRACAALGGCTPGGAKLTPGFALAARWIAHAVGPVWRGGRDNEEETLASCYRRCLQLADEVRARSIAFPAISTGVYGFPRERAAEIAVHTVEQADTNVQEVRLVAYDTHTLSLYESLLA